MTGQTIYALSSGHGRAGVAVIRVSGPAAGHAVHALAGALPQPRRAALKALRDPDNGELLDRGLVLWFPAPRSFTGEDMAEFHVHGGRAVTSGLLAALARFEGFRPAGPGEFARRALENGKLDLTGVEGLADLIDAETEAQRRQALRQTSGALSKLYENWRSDLVRAMALVEAGLDFSDEEDVSAEVEAAARPIVKVLHAAVAAHLDDGRRGEILRDGLSIVIAGPPNAGKSSLLNALARRDAAIVSEEAGTTRDIIEVHLNLGGYPVIVTDTAGLREAAGKIEQEGIRRALRRVDDADIVLWLIDMAQPSPPLPEALARQQEKVITVANKIDLIASGRGALSPTDALPISAKTGAGLQELTERLLREAEQRIGMIEAPVITRSRHRRELRTCLAALERFLQGDPRDGELRAEDLRQAAQSLGRLTGRVDVEDILDKIFAEFCIGK